LIAQTDFSIDPMIVLERIDEMREFFWLVLQSNPELLARVEPNLRLAVEQTRNDK
jgi:hypothetical protein